MIDSDSDSRLVATIPGDSDPDSDFAPLKVTQMVTALPELVLAPSYAPFPAAGPRAHFFVVTLLATAHPVEKLAGKHLYLRAESEVRCEVLSYMTEKMSMSGPTQPDPMALLTS